MRFSLAVAAAFLVLLNLHAFAQNSPTARPPVVPPEPNLRSMVVVEDEESLAKTRIRTEVMRLLGAQDYRGLDTLAEQLQRNGKTFARGYWEISYFFSELTELPTQATDEEWETHMQKMRDWFEQDPDSVFARIGMAQALLEYAWKARGNSWAHKVTDEGWQLVAERLAEARRIMVAAEALPHNCPVFYSTQMDIAQLDGESRESYDQLFAEAIEAFPTYSRFYQIRANYLLPRWYGGLGEWENFANLTADRIGGEEGDVLYTQIVWRMHDTRSYGNILSEASVDWSRIQRGFEALCRRYPNSLSAPSEYCSISGFAPKGARRLMRNLFARLENRVDLSVWKTAGYFRRDYKWAFSEPEAEKSH